MYYDRSLFLKLVPHLRDSNHLRDAVEKLHKENSREFERRQSDINAAARDAKAIALGLEADPDSMAYKMAVAFLEDAQSELERSK